MNVSVILEPIETSETTLVFYFKDETKALSHGHFNWSKLAVFFYLMTFRTVDKGSEQLLHVNAFHMCILF